MENPRIVESEHVLNELDGFEFEFDFDENNWDELLDTKADMSGDLEQVDSHLTKQTTSPLVVPVKAKRSSQFMHKRVLSKAAKRRKEKEDARKTSNISLSASPVLDRSQSVLYFPHKFSRLLNSGDHTGLGQLLNRHLDHTCKVKLFDHSMDVKTFWAYNVLMRDLTPDVVMCVHTTNVVSNQIRASAYLKYTDKKVIFDSVTKNITNPEVKEMYGTERSKKLRKTLKSGNPVRQAEEELLYNDLVESDADVVLYVALEIVLTLDCATRKVVDMLFDSRITSMKAADTL